jgi:hypothetical protein
MMKIQISFQNIESTTSVQKTIDKEEMLKIELKADFGAESFNLKGFFLT